MLGAAGANVGTRFLASEEATADPEWKRRIGEIESDETVRFVEWASFFPSSGYDVVPRVIRTEFVERWTGRPGEAGEHAERLRGEIIDSIRTGRPHELTPVTGQTAGLIRDVRPAGEIVRELAAEAEAALDRARG